MSLRAKVYGLLATLVLLGGGFYAYKAKPAWFGGVAQAKAGDDKKTPEKEATPVELAMATRSEIAAFLSSTANLRALREVTVSTQAEGIVQKVLAEEGDFVKEGQVLCTLDDAPVRIRLQLAQEKLEQAKLQMEKARIRQQKAAAQIGHTQAEFDRYEKARKEGLVSDKEVATYKYKLEELQHDERSSVSESKEFQHKVGELQAEIAQTKLDLSRTEVRAPFAGFVTLRTVNVGQRLKPNDNLFNLGAFSPLFADVHLSEKDTRAVRSGQPATVRLGSDDTATVQGRVERISPVVDQASGTVKVTVAMEPQPGFRPGAFVRVEIRTDTKADAIVIPKRALVEEDGQNYVYVATKDTAKRTKVSLGYQREGMVEIREGVSAGENVVVAGQGALKEGGKIKVLSRPTAASANTKAGV
ncbi:MAG TPA: efflux RND transporter periplasmic adaptor subunit [Bryobacteraceae bacterium]|nr:efflux RND transporter periplasmic adaptor subunit [Bryobacteraceae bacterium]